MKAGQVSRMSSPSNFYGRVAEVSFVHSGSVIAVYLFLAACSLLLALNSLTFDTDPGKMISQELPFRKDFIAFKSAFPMFDNAFLLVVEADNAKDTEKTGQSLVQSLRKKPELLHEVFAPELDDFLQRNGFLFLPLKQLTGMTRKSCPQPLPAGGRGKGGKQPGIVCFVCASAGSCSQYISFFHPAPGLFSQFFPASPLWPFLSLWVLGSCGNVTRRGSNIYRGE